MRMTQDETPNASEGFDDQAADVAQERFDPVVTSAPPPAPPDIPSLLQVNPRREIKTAEQLAAMILADLSETNGCPKVGVNVTVYGSNPWNSWLSFGSKAGPVHNKAELQAFCDIITERLKRLYDISV